MEVRGGGGGKGEVEKPYLNQHRTLLKKCNGKKLAFTTIWINYEPSLKNGSIIIIMIIITE